MGLFRVKRSDEDEDYGHIEGYRTSDGHYGTEDEACFFSTRKAAFDAIKTDKWQGDYQFDIEEMD